MDNQQNFSWGVGNLGFGPVSVFFSMPLEKYYTFHIFPCWFTKYINIFLSVYIFDPSHLKHLLKLFRVRSTDDTFDRKKVHSGKVFQWSLRLKTPLVMLLLHHLLVAVTQGKIMVDTLEGCIYPPWCQVKTERSSSSYHMKSIQLIDFLWTKWKFILKTNSNLAVNKVGSSGFDPRDSADYKVCKTVAKNKIFLLQMMSIHACHLTNYDCSFIKFAEKYL